MVRTRLFWKLFAGLSVLSVLTAALVGYRITELELQRDMGLLEVDSEGGLTEFDPSRVSGDPLPL